MDNNIDNFYYAMLSEPNPENPSTFKFKRISVYAESFDDARKQLELEYGEGNIHDLTNEVAANRIR